MTTTRLPAGPSDARVDARLGLGTAAIAVLGFAALVVLPYAVDGSAPPAADLVWGVGGGLTMVLAPVAAGLAGCASCVALWRRDLDSPTRRLHLLTLLAVAGLAVFLASQPGQAVIAWWRD